MVRRFNLFLSKLPVFTGKFSLLLTKQGNSRFSFLQVLKNNRCRSKWLSLKYFSGLAKTKIENCPVLLRVG